MKLPFLLRRSSYALLLFLLAAPSALAQTPGSMPMTDTYGHMGIGTITPDKSALLDLSSTTAGFLMPRMTSAERSALANPAVGLMIYNTDTKTIEFNIGTTFAPIWDPVLTTSSGSGLYWSLTGNAGTSSAVNFIGTTDAESLVMRTNNIERLRVASTGEVGIGTSPVISRRLTVGGGAGVSNVRFGSASGAADASAWAPTANDGFLTADANGDLLKRSASATVGAVAWLKTGNGGAFTDGTDNLLGTTSNAALNVIVNGARAMRYEPNATSPNVIGGFNGNAVTAGAVGATIAGGGQSGSTNRVTDDYGVVGGGQNNRAGDNAGLINDALYATVGGGEDNTASGPSAMVGGGTGNTASGDYSTVGGGLQNMAPGTRSTVGGGNSNTASGNRSTVGGGNGNTASSSYSTVGGGVGNTASNDNSTVAGGSSNSSSGYASTVGGGFGNTASNDNSTVAGGNSNRASGGGSTVGGGISNTASGDFSAIPGGRGLTLDAVASGSFGFLGANTGANNMTISTPDVAVFGNADLWLANNDNAPSELRFFEAYNTAGAFPNTANYTAFKAQTQAANITYTLPASAPASNGDVLTGTTAGVMSWADADSIVTANAWGLLGNANTNPATNFLGTTDNQAFEIHVDNGGTATEGRRRVMRFEPNATSANIIGGFNGNSVTAGAVGATIAGGGVTGNANVVTDDYGVVGGGRHNRAGNNGGTTSDRQYATVSGGYGNVASGDYATVSGGDRNDASGSNATLGGGSINAALGSYSTVDGGNVNVASGSYSTVGGGSNNRTSGSAATVGGGTNNIASGFYATVGGGFRNIDSGDYSAIPGGLGLTLAPTADRSFGFHANNNVGTRDMTISASDVAVFGNADLWLANNDGAPSELRFFEAYNTAGAFPNTANYTAFKAQAQTGDITYTLPASAPAASGDVLTGTTAGVMSWSDADSIVTVNAWGLLGNANTNPATNFLGTTDNQAFEIRVNNAGAATGGNQRVMRFEPNGTSANIIGGFNGNSVTAGVVGATIAGGGSNANTNRVTDDYGVVGGGQNNRAGNNAGGTNDASYSTVGGGQNNTASGDASTAGGGYTNMASGAASTVGGGSTNTASATYSTVGGGSTNTASGGASTVGGGESNTASATYSTVGGGYTNSASGDYSAIPGGRGLTLDAAAARSFGFHANTAAGDRNMTISASDVAVFGNTDLWLANNDGLASELRFFEAQNAAGAFPSPTTNYTAFKAQAQTGNITYTLPPSAPTTTGQILSATTGGVMSWVDGPTLAQSFSNNSSTTPTLNLTNSNATGTALQISDGKMVVSTASYASAGTIGGDVVAAHVNDNGVGSSAATITLPTGVAGQILYVSTADPDGVAISDGVTTIYTLADDDVVVTLLFIGGKWKPIP